MEKYRYTAIPLIDNKGRYVGTLTEGDLLWKLKNTPDLNFKNTDGVLLREIPTRMNNKSVRINSDMKDLISLAVNQNFVPVIDDKNVFIGIIKRSDIINYCYRQLFNKKNNVIDIV
jgi:CBS-domain-containing membrane protein